jgi:hypothetical protein
MRDPKFGYHWIWMLPVYIILSIYDYIATVVISSLKRMRMRWIFFRYPEIKRMHDLANK